jgi:Tol biopolymer transport system component
MASVAAISLALAVAIAGAFTVSRARASAPAPAPQVLSITQITHDGFRKLGLLADDSQVFVTEMQGQNRAVAKLSSTGPERSVLASPFPNLQALDLSPDRTKLLVAPSTGGFQDDELFTIPVNGGSPERIAGLTGRDPAWSPDGQTLVFGQGPVLNLAASDGTHMHGIFTANGAIISPTFSPDGQRIRFSVTDPWSTSLWEVGRDGSNPHPLLANWRYSSKACCGRWTADGRYYIFQTTQNAPETSLVVTTLWALADSASTAGSDAETNAPVSLTAGPASFSRAWPAPDNKTLWAIGVQPKTEVVAYDPAKKKFLPLAGGISATDVAFSSDGKWITYVSLPDETLWRSRTNGSDKLQLTFPPERAVLPQFSPDGKQISYAASIPGQPWKIYVVSADGQNSHLLLPQTRGVLDANWSRGGSKIMFGYVHDSATLKISILDLKTQEIQDIPGSEGLFSPRWSPDGRYIVAMSPDYTLLRLYDFETQKWVDWVKEPAGAVSYPLWSSDSKSIYFDDLVTDEETVRRLKVGETQAQRVLQLQGVDRYAGPFGPWFGRAHNGSWMVVRDRSTQEVYRLTVELP